MAGSDATDGGSMPSNVGGIMLEFVINLGTTFLHIQSDGHKTMKIYSRVLRLHSSCSLIKSLLILIVVKISLLMS